VVVIRRGDEDGVEVLLLLAEKLAVIVVGVGVGQVFSGGAEAIEIDVADGGDVRAGLDDLIEIAPPATAYADACDVERGVLRLRRRRERPAARVGAARPCASSPVSMPVRRPRR
jgi:hypothetical protein